MSARGAGRWIRPLAPLLLLQLLQLLLDRMLLLERDRLARLPS